MNERPGQMQQYAKEQQIQCGSDLQVATDISPKRIGHVDLHHNLARYDDILGSCRDETLVMISMKMMFLFDGKICSPVESLESEIEGISLCLP